MRTIVLVLILVAPVALPAASAQGAGPDVTVQSTAVGFSASGEDAGRHFELQFDLASATVDYQARFDGEGATTGLAFAVIGVAEFYDRDGDGRYGLGDETVRVLPIAGSPNATVAIADRSATAYYPWPTTQGIVDRIAPAGGIHIRFGFGADTPLPGVAMDVEVDRAPRSQEGTRFALLLEVEGATETGGSRILTVAGDGADVDLRWQGPPIGPVAASSVLHATDTTLAIASPLSSLEQRFFLEPKLHPTIALPTLAGNPLAYGLAFVAAAAAAGTPMALRWRRRP